MAETSTSNMSLTLPGVGTTQGPDYATQINNNFSTIDSHDHSAGKGTPITPAGISITTDLSFNSTSATNIKTARFSSQVAAPATASDIRCLYAVGGDLYYTDGNGVSIRLTSSGGIAGTPGSISGLTSPASASFQSATGTFIFQSGANVAGNLDGRNVTLRTSTAGSFGVTLNAPPALAANYNITLPAGLQSVEGYAPLDNRFMTMNGSGAIQNDLQIDNDTIGIDQNGKLAIIGLNGVDSGQLAPSRLGKQTFMASSTMASTQNVSAGATVEVTSISIPLASVTDKNAYYKVSLIPSPLSEYTGLYPSGVSAFYSGVGNYEIAGYFALQLDGAGKNFYSAFELCSPYGFNSPPPYFFMPVPLTTTTVRISLNVKNLRGSTQSVTANFCSLFVEMV